MRFRRNENLDKNFLGFGIISFIDVIFLLSLILGMTSLLTVDAGVKVSFSKKISSEQFREETLEVRISSEDVIYLNGSVATLKELGKKIVNPRYQKTSLNIIVDRRASMGRIMDVWELCRKTGMEKINLITP